MQFNGLLPARVELKKKKKKKKTTRTVNKQPQGQNYKMNTKNFLWKIYINETNFAFLKFKKCFDHLPHHKAKPL